VHYSWDALTDTLTATGSRGVLFTLVVTDAAAGAYHVTLLDNVLHAPGNAEASATVDLAYVITDADGSTAPGALTITFNDDAPTFTHIDTAIIANEDNNVLIGTHDLNFGADGVGSIEISPQTTVSGVTYLPVVHNADGSAELIAQAGGSDLFDLKINIDGTYAFTLIDSRPSTNETFSLQGVNGGAAQTQFTLGDATFHALDSSGNNVIDDKEMLKPTSNGFGVGDGNLDPGEQFRIDFGLSVDKLSFQVNHESSGPFTMSWTTNTGQTGIATTSSDGLLTIDPTLDFTTISFTVTDGKAKFDSFEYSKLLLPPDVSLTFSVHGVDGDGDLSATQTLSVNLLGQHSADTPINGTAADDAIQGSSANDIINGLGGNDTLSGGAGSDTLDGGAGHNTLSGGLGSDTFVIDPSAMTEGVSLLDLIADFKSSEDLLDLSKLLASVGVVGQSAADAAVDVAVSGNAALVSVNGHEVASLTGVGHNSVVSILYDASHTYQEHVA
jgi:Ca2+-binding RTX toxin-like protein